MISSTGKLLRSALFEAIVIACVFQSTAHAQTLPDEGSVDRDGSPIASESSNLDFVVSDESGEDGSVWRYCAYDVPVVAGAFHVQIGDTSRPPAWVFLADEVYVSIAIREFDGATVGGCAEAGATLKQLAGEQTIRPTSWAPIGPPPGSVMAFAGAEAPVGWLICDGRALSSALYPNLFGALGTAAADCGVSPPPRRGQTTAFLTPFPQTTNL